MIYLDIMKIPRPERSGVIANLVAYALLWGWGYALVPHDFGDGFDLKCYLAPWMCPKAPETAKEEIARRYNTVLLSPFGGKKKCCTCHIDLRYDKDGVVMHLHSREEATCDSEGVEPKQWTTAACRTFHFTWDGKEDEITSCTTTIIVDGETFSMTSSEEEYRWHCE